MPTIQIEVQISGDALFEAALQLGPRELDQFMARLQTLRTERSNPEALSNAPVLSEEESSLLLFVNEGFSLDERVRLEALVQQRHVGVLPEEANAELEQLSSKSEI